MNAQLVLCASILVLIGVACGSFRPPENCPFGSGAADTEAFAASFSDMSIRTTAGTRGEAARDSEYRFGRGDQLEIVAVATSSTLVQFCVGERKGGGKLVMNESIALDQGSVRIPLDVHGPGRYVARVGVGGKIVRNLTFEIE